jgi:hypothetical protein
MAHMSTDIMKISLKLFNKFWHELNLEQRGEVLETYYDHY